MEEQMLAKRMQKILIRRSASLRHPNEARNKLERWILSVGGSGFVSRMLGVSQLTVGNWQNGKAQPSLDAVYALIKASGGYLDFFDIYAASRPNKRALRAKEETAQQKSEEGKALED